MQTTKLYLFNGRCLLTSVATSEERHKSASPGTTCLSLPATLAEVTSRQHRMSVLSGGLYSPLPQTNSNHRKPLINFDSPKRASLSALDSKSGRRKSRRSKRQQRRQSKSIKSTTKSGRHGGGLIPLRVQGVIYISQQKLRVAVKRSLPSIRSGSGGTRPQRRRKRKVERKRDKEEEEEVEIDEGDETK